MPLAPAAHLLGVWTNFRFKCACRGSLVAASSVGVRDLPWLTARLLPLGPWLSGSVPHPWWSVGSREAALVSRGHIPGGPADSMVLGKETPGLGWSLCHSGCGLGSSPIVSSLLLLDLKASGPRRELSRACPVWGDKLWLREQDGSSWDTGHRCWQVHEWGRCWQMSRPSPTHADPDSSLLSSMKPSPS